MTLEVSGLFAQKAGDLVSAVEQKRKAEAKIKDSLYKRASTEKNDTLKADLLLSICQFSEPEEQFELAEKVKRLTDSVIRGLKNEQLIRRLLSRQGKSLRYTQAYYEDKLGFQAPRIIEILREAQGIFVKARDYPEFVSASFALADNFFKQGRSLDALNAYQQLLDSTRRWNYKVGQARTLFSLQNFYSILGDTSQVYAYMEQAMKIEREINDPRRLARSYFLRGKSYFRLQKFKEAVPEFLTSVDKYLALKATSEMPEIYFHLGVSYSKSGEYRKGLAWLDSAINAGNRYDVLQYVFFGMLSKGAALSIMGDLPAALEVHRDVYKTVLQFDSKDPLRMVLGELALDYYRAKDYKKAKEYLDKKLVYVRETGVALDLLPDEKLAYQVDSALGNHKEALEHYRAWVTLKEKLNSEELQKAATRNKLQAQFEKQELERKAEQDKKDVEYAEEKRRQNIIIISVSIGLFLVLLLAIFVFRSYRQKQKANEALTEKNLIIEKQKHLVEEKHKEITDSINYAERIQRSFMATKELLDAELNEYFVMFKPKDVVSGDFYWAAKLKNGAFALATADSTGHGVPGAIMSLLNITSLEKAIEHHTDPAEILNHTRRTIIERLKKDGSAEGGKDGMDCSLICIDYQNKTLQIAAANNPVWLIRKNGSGPAAAASQEVFEIKADKMPVGKHDKDQTAFSSQTLQLEAGDIIYTITDGFPDQFGGAKGKKFMSKNLREFLAVHSELSMSEQKTLLEKKFKDWIGNLEQVDDITVIGIRI